VPLKTEKDSIDEKVSVVFSFPKVDGFDANWREFMIKKQGSKYNKNED